MSRSSIILPASVFAFVVVSSLVFETKPAKKPPGPSGDDAEPFAPREPQTDCDPTEKPGVQFFRSYMLSTYGGYDDGIVRACDVGGVSEHKEGRAWDWGITAYQGKEAPDVEAALDDILAQNAELFRRAGMLYIIYNRRIWSGAGARDWVPYTGDNPHTDHVHFSFSKAGARGETSFYRSPQPVV